jgi:hypothetical protein
MKWNVVPSSISIAGKGSPLSATGWFQVAAANYLLSRAETDEGRRSLPAPGPECFSIH